MPAAAPPRPDYGLDAPGVVRNLVLLGMFCAVFALVVLISPPDSALNKLRWAASRMLPWMALGYFLAALAMVWSSKVGKLRARDVILAKLALRGDETVLDVGCGRGLLLIGAAKRLPRGKAIGVDLWSAADLSGNGREATLAIARAEGVSARVELKDADMRDLPLGNESVDAVISSLAVHNIRDRHGRRVAMSEIARVVRQNGRVVILDIAHVKEYADDLAAAGLLVARVKGFSRWIFPPARFVVARKLQR